MTQRVHRDDTDLVATGATPTPGSTNAQASPGPPGEGRTPMTALLIGNCSGFYGDRLAAMREMLEGSVDGRASTSSPVTTWPS